MQSKNFTILLIVGFYFVFILNEKFASSYVGSKCAYLALCALLFPVILIVRKRYLSSVSMIIVGLTFVGTLSLIRYKAIAINILLELIYTSPIPIYSFLVLLLPGLFFISELDTERLPHELSYWSSSNIFRPLVAITAVRERLLRRFAVIKEICSLRGIDIFNPVQFISNIHIWLVVLANSTVVETAYAHKYRAMIGSAHRFIPKHDKRPVISNSQKTFFVLLIVALFTEITRALKP